MKKSALQFVASVAVVSFSVTLFAQLPKPTGTTAVLAGRLVDVRSGAVTTHKYIIVENDRIARIVDAAPAGVAVIDLSKLTVVPGLIDCHAHTLSDPTSQSWASGLRMSSADATLWGVYNLQIWLAHGFTTLRDAGRATQPTDRLH